MILELLGVSRQNQMIIREYMPAMLLIAGSFLLSNIGKGVYNNHSSEGFLNQLSAVINETIGTGIWFGGLAMLVLGTLLFFYSTYRLWKWEKGEVSGCCDYCSGLVTEKYGRYGAYYKCLACGSTRSIRR